jgi:hypothetical protein
MDTVPWNRSTPRRPSARAPAARGADATAGERAEEKERDPELVACGVVAREEERRDQAAQLGGAQPVAAVLRLDQRGHEVVLGPGTALRDERLDVGADAEETRGDLVQVGADLERQDPGERVRPPAEQLVVLPRHAEELADQLDRVVVGELGHELARPARHEAIGQLLGERAHRRPEPLDRARREGAAHEPPEPRMRGPVDREERQRDRLVDGPFDEALEPDEIEERASQAGVRDQLEDLRVLDDERADRRARETALPAELVDSRRRVRDEFGIEDVEVRSLVERPHPS